MPHRRTGRRRAPARAAVVAVAMFGTAGVAMAAGPVQPLADTPRPAPAPDHHAARDRGALRVAAEETTLQEHAHRARQRAVTKRWLVTVALQREARRSQRLPMWDRLAQCETAGNWQDGGDYGGGLGIYVGTWRAYGGTEFAARPQWATKEQQITVAERIALDGMGGWGCAHRLGLAS